MRCKNCGIEWTISIHGNSVQKFCPVCGKPVFEDAPRKLTSFEETLFVIRRDHGMGYLQDSTRIMACFTDLAPHLRKEKIMLQYLLQCNGNRLLIAALQKTPSEQQVCLKQLASRLADDLLLSEATAQMICSSFWNAITISKEPEDCPPPEEIFEASCDCEESNIGKSLQFLTKSAEAGYFSAQFKLAKWYRDGRIIKRDPEKAMYWYQKAADSKNYEAQCNLGWCYATGFGCEKNPMLAAVYFSKAADAGITIAQYNLAKCYESGSGVEKDLSRAALLYEQAAKANHTKAQYHFGRCYEYGLGLTADIALAIYWYGKAAQNEVAEAQFALGRCYEHGRGVDRDSYIAYYWYKRASKNGHKEAEKIILTL